jgi:hypothetical protein
MSSAFLKHFNKKVPETMQVEEDNTLRKSNNEYENILVNKIGGFSLYLVLYA